MVANWYFTEKIFPTPLHRNKTTPRFVGDTAQASKLAWNFTLSFPHLKKIKYYYCSCKSMTVG